MPLQIDWKLALKYAQLVKIAESVKPDGGYSRLQIGALNDLGYSFISTIYGSDLATDIHPNAADVVTFGFLAASADGELVVSIRGTDTLLEWAHDAEFLMVPSPIGYENHLITTGATDDGFTAVYKSLRVGDPKDGPTPDLFLSTYSSAGRPTKQLTICGHSLGGALATLLALDAGLNTPFISPVCYTYASPRVGDHTFAGKYAATVPNTFRIANRMDAVSMLPTIFPLLYEHVATHFEIRSKQPLFGSIPCLHHLTSYLWLLSQLAGVPGFELDADCIEHPG